MSKKKINISPVISSDILKTISSSTIIKSFGAQLKNKSKETLIVGNQTKTADIQAEKESLTKESEQLGEQESSTIEKARKDFNTNQITEKQYNDIVGLVQAATLAKRASIDLKIAKLTQDEQNINNNPNNKIKNQQKLFKTRVKGLRKKSQNAESKSKRDLAKQVISNATKTLGPIIALQFANQFSNVISQRKKLEELVDQINLYIDTQVKDTQTVAIAINLRNNAITLINNNIKKLENIKRIIDIFTIIVTVMSAILQIVNIPPSVISDKIAQRLRIIISALSAILAIASSLLANEIIKLKELIDRLKEISLKLDNKILTDLNSNEFNALTNAFLPTGGEYGAYKGFTFKIKEEQNQQFVVKGNKRRYAVAIDRYGVEQLKSEYSFTLDPNDLIEQLKLVIDQQNLQG